MEDQEIVKALKGGDTSALKYCYDKAYVSVKRMVVENSGSQNDATDIFHDTLLIFYKNCLNLEFNLTSTLKTYLYAISWRLWMTELRKNRLNAASPFVELVSEFDFELQHKNQDLLNDIMDIIKDKGEKCLEILKAFYFNKLNYDQIAKKLGYSSEHVVREQKYRCLKRIRQEVKQSNFSYEG